MKFIKILLTFLLSITLSTTAYSAPKRILYVGNPIDVVLSVNVEKRITFPDAKLIAGSVNEKLTSEGILSVDIVNNDVFLTALKPFKKDRNIFLKEGSGDVYLLDLVGTQAKLTKQRLIIAKGEDRHSIAEKDKKVVPEKVISALKNNSGKNTTAGYKTLVDFANREIYAPDRLRGGVSGVYRASLQPQVIRNLLRNNKVVTKTIASWRSSSLYVTAISVSNNTNEPLNLSPFLIRGSWKAASFRRSKLSPKNSPFDETTLFLVSNKEFIHAVESNPIIKLSRK